ncbi:MAG: hypothetical protein ACHQ50_00990 [Fimbriimonadales bacterium]
MVRKQPVNGALVLTLGILSLAGFNILTGIPAWVLGNIALDQIDAGYGNPNERNLVVVGRFLGMLVSGIFIGAAIITIVSVVVLRIFAKF